MPESISKQQALLVANQHCRELVELIEASEALLDQAYTGQWDSLIPAVKCRDSALKSTINQHAGVEELAPCLQYINQLHQQLMDICQSAHGDIVHQLKELQKNSKGINAYKNV